MTPLFEPINGHAARDTRPPAQRVSEHASLAARGDGRLRRDPLRSDGGRALERSGGPAESHTRHYPDIPNPARRNPAHLFFVQHFAQEVAPERRPAMPHHSGAAAYASLPFDNDILLPGETVPLSWVSRPRLDILI